MKQIDADAVECRSKCEFAARVLIGGEFLRDQAAVFVVAAKKRKI